MRKLTFSVITASLLFCPTFANESIFAKTNEKGEINASEQKRADEKVRNLHNEANLNHLFENSKFPVDGYIYKAGFREPKIQNDELTKALQKLEELEKQQSNNTTKISDQKDQEFQEAQERNRRANELKTQLKEQNQNLKQEIRQDTQTAYERKIKRLLKDELLGERNNAIKEMRQNNNFGVDSFSNQKPVDISTNEHRLYRTIRAGRMIPAILTTAISSDLSGIVTAQIEQDIYATMGRAVLIPRGSKAIGFYTNNTKIGHERLEIKWREIITPQGINIMLTEAIVADNMGMNGAVGAINNKYWERYGIAYSISTITNALLLGIVSKINNGNNTNNQYVSEIYSNARSDVSSVVQDIIQQQSQIKPTIEIKSGSRIFLVPTNHMWFAKPKNGEVLMKYFIEE
ncbi:DNA type IV secretion system protein ComB10 [Campylobacter sp. faydin G-140]|uniref:DNA type IV secretion system protein ComB10 n=1 Tax=Campylobacter anatolicus TaxID=2829105 RepID=UPI001B928127|nr:DNA type IV secretion system protein ComB10 [Campylobacter anatolicus]MBR8466528.1 DNA type IV secretion system protein ComB10 [Campylobacter anatolicus]